MRGLFNLQGLPIMLTLGKILGALTTTGTNPGIAVWYKRILAEGTTLIALAIVTGITAAALIIGVFFGAYIYLRHIGLEPLSAVGIVASVALLATGGLILYIMERLRRFKHLPFAEHDKMAANDDHSTHFADMLGRAGSVADAFLDGLRYPEREGGVRHSNAVHQRPRDNVR